jgi:hypothetical protein
MIELNLKDVPRTWTREQWKAVSRWLRISERHLSKISLSTILYNIMLRGQKNKKVECRVCVHNLVYHGTMGCFRAWVKNGPVNCTGFRMSVHAN